MGIYVSGGLISLKGYNPYSTSVRQDRIAYQTQTPKLDFLRTIDATL